MSALTKSKEMRSHLLEFLGGLLLGFLGGFLLSLAS